MQHNGYAIYFFIIFKLFHIFTPMKQPIFIRLENNLEEAMYSRTSPQMNIYSFKGVHLKPNEIYPYKQRTYASEGINLSNPDEVFVCDLCGNVLGDISDYFTVDLVFQDPDTGLTQIYWSIVNVQDYDFGNQLVYLKIRQGANVFFYSSPFELTAEGAEYTSRWDYGNKLNTGEMLSTGLKIWFKQLLDFEETETYDNVTSNRRTAVGGKLIPYEAWQTSIIDINLFRLIKQMRRNIYVYCDLQKTTPFEPFETPQLVGKENFSEAEILLCRDEGNVFDPNYLPPVPPPPPPIVPTITLLSVVSVNANQVQYTFTYANFEPTNLTLEYTQDGINWAQNTGSVISPRINTVPNNQTQFYAYRVKHIPTGTVSNVLQLNLPTLTITNVSAPSFYPDGYKAKIFYTFNNFVPTQQFMIEASVDGITWVGTLYGAELPPVIGNSQSHVVTTLASPEPYKFFRMKYDPLHVLSNTYEI